MCPQSAPSLDAQTESVPGQWDSSQAIDLEAFCTACFVIDLLKLSPGAVLEMHNPMFFTKLSTDSVQRCHGSLQHCQQVLRAPLNKSVAAPASSLWMVCGVANTRHSLG
jgi:hypothetical protein